MKNIFTFKQDCLRYLFEMINIFIENYKFSIFLTVKIFILYYQSKGYITIFKNELKSLY